MNNLKQLETREVNVGENIFYIRPLPAFKAANMTGELAALVLPLVSGLAPLLSAVDTERRAMVCSTSRWRMQLPRLRGLSLRSMAIRLRKS